jgi:DNA repair protein RadC
MSVEYKIQKNKGNLPKAEKIIATNPERKDKKPIDEWILDEQPREMLMKIGAENLPPSKLLAIVLRTGITGTSAEDLGKKLLDRFGSLRGLDNASVPEISTIKGIGMVKAVQIKAGLELGKRLMREETKQKPRIKTLDDVINYYMPYMRDLKEEIFKVMLLDSRNKLLMDVTISKGSLNASIVHPREVIKTIVRESAAAVIFVHNHPSGETEPTKDDIEITKRLAAACELIEVRVLDHIIIGGSGYTSFVDKGLIKGD